MTRSPSPIPEQSFLRRVLPLLVLLAGPAAVLYLASGPLVQDPEYHNFADQRPCLGVPHMQNVVTNAPFLLVGGLGLYFLGTPAAGKAFRTQAERWPFALFFVGILLTGAGSAYYHLDPTNPTLTWDRLPIAGAFMALFAGVLGERLGTRLGLAILLPLVLLGTGSVVYWHVTEAAGVGDLRPYILVQGYPLIAIPLLLLLYPAPYTCGSGYVVAILWYGLAKALEIGDHAVYHLLGHVVSGHALKHLVSAVGAYWVLRMLRVRIYCHDVYQRGFMSIILVVGTRNPKKRQEILEILDDLPIDLRDLTTYPGAPEVIEDGDTFEANARKKASELAKSLGEWVLGEDSGLVVPALDGQPGVFSARYAGIQGDDEANNARLLADLAPLSEERRAAYYVCTAALADPTGVVRTVVEGRCHGTILRERRGSGGFGYDPLFLVPEYHKTFGELSSRAKHALSHRARALARLRPELRRLLGGGRDGMAEGSRGS